MGTTTRNTQTDQDLLHQHFFHEFAPSAVAIFLPKIKFYNLEFATKGVINFDRVRDISEDVFKVKLRRVLVCLVCGTTLHTADEILKSADFKVISTSYGKLLTLVRREALELGKREDLVLISTSLWYLQGFLIGQLRERGCFIIGRTVIPNSELWDKVQDSV
ncbi:hypothetical protein Moror_10860 [Moniliophthora roreri MCA 2997]|uniref:Uncharacterized protein n=1 Tax=Moniliophthora roreri (strain MCA 2997) TaxID=1381753 RepID=V2X678_MONRO|nr:hypothetical protein Moror_10860 [Moniliophthora roreri MCA 2997]